LRYKQQCNKMNFIDCIYLCRNHDLIFQVYECKFEVLNITFYKKDDNIQAVRLCTKLISLQGR